MSGFFCFHNFGIWSRSLWIKIGIFWAFPSVGLSAISFLWQKKPQKRIPLLSLTQKKDSKRQRFSIKNELPLALARVF